LQGGDQGPGWCACTGFMISTATIARRTGVLPRWLAVLGVVLAVGLLAVVSSDEPVLLLFPAWVLLVSTHLLLATRGARR
jgi:hypothetical protein